MKWIGAGSLVGWSFFPYYEHCDRFPVKKCDCDVWISRGTSPEQLTATDLMRRLSGEVAVFRKYALFFTSFHPLKQEGNSKLMRIWLEHLKKAGYQVHVVYYMYDRRDVSSELRRQAFYEYDLYLEVDVVSKMTGSNECGLNVHVDDWCGGEALNAVARLTSWFEYDIAITNYPVYDGDLPAGRRLHEEDPIDARQLYRSQPKNVGAGLWGRRMGKHR
jgi:hypothetical protein